MVPAASPLARCVRGAPSACLRACSLLPSSVLAGALSSEKLASAVLIDGEVLSNRAITASSSSSKIRRHSYPPILSRAVGPRRGRPLRARLSRRKAAYSDLMGGGRLSSKVVSAPGSLLWNRWHSSSPDQCSIAERNIPEVFRYIEVAVVAHSAVSPLRRLVNWGSWVVLPRLSPAETG